MDDLFFGIVVCVFVVESFLRILWGNICCVICVVFFVESLFVESFVVDYSLTNLCLWNLVVNIIFC